MKTNTINNEKASAKRPSNRATKVANVETAITLWKHPDGREYYFVEARCEKGDGDKVRERIYIDNHHDASGRPSKRKALAAARKERDKAQQARLTGENIKAEPVKLDKQRTPLADFFRGPYTEWARAGNIATSTWRNYRRRMTSFVLPLLKGMRLREIDRALVTELSTVLAMPRCAECDQKQQKEEKVANREQRPRRRYGYCSRPGCGYGASRLVVSEVVLTLSAVLSHAKRLGYIERHPLNDDPDYKHRRPGSQRRISQRTPDMIEPVRLFLNPVEDLVISLLLYVGLRPQEALALLWRDLIDENYRPKGLVNVSKAIKETEPLKPGERPRLEAVEGVLAPLYVSPLLKTGTDGARPSQIQRSPELWPQLGQLALEVWKAVGCPPLDTFVVLNATGPYKGYPPSVPGNWMQKHYRKKCAMAGVHYDRNDSAYGLRHIAASMLAVGPRWSTREIAGYVGNSELVCARIYQHPFGSTGAAEYRGLQMSQVIELARAQAGTDVPGWATTADADVA